MRKLDLDMVRPQIGEFKFQGTTYKIFKPTIGQLLTRRKEYEMAERELKKLESPNPQEEGYSTDYLERLNTWKAREISIFIPEFDKVEEMTEDQRTKVLEMIFEVEENSESLDEPAKKKPAEQEDQG